MTWSIKTRSTDYFKFAEQLNHFFITAWMYTSSCGRTPTLETWRSTVQPPEIPWGRLRKWKKFPLSVLLESPLRLPKENMVNLAYGTLSESRPGSKANSISCKHNATHRSQLSVYICPELAANLGLPQMILKALHKKYAKAVTSFSGKETYLLKATALHTGL